MDSDRTVFNPESLLALWAGVLLAPLAWFLHQQVSYVLVYRACDTGSRVGFAIWTVVTLSIVGAGASLAWSAWDNAGRGWSDTGDSVRDRNRFLGLCGLMSSVLFSLVIAAQWIPTFLVGPCAR